MNLHALKYGYDWLIGQLYCRMQGVKFGPNLRTYGCPIVIRHSGASITLGSHVVLNSNPRVNPAGIKGKVSLTAIHYGSEITIGNHTGLSGVAIVAAKCVRIGSYVNVGVNTLIYDTDLHPLDIQERRDNNDSVAVAEVVIEDDVWIGANCIILKGAHVGRGAVIGAGSVVTSNIPEATIWAGNPARMIRAI